MPLSYELLQPTHFDSVLTLGNRVQGEGYLSLPALEAMYEQGFHKQINASCVALKNGTVVGFRITYAHTKWSQDDWCTPDKWGVEPSNVCYFKCNTVDENLQGTGVGSELLRIGVEQAKKQGAIAGLAHIWLGSPGNSAFRYFTKNGGELIAKHPGKWRHASIHEGYDCPACPEYCECEGAEMLLKFS